MSENWSAQVSIKTPAGTLINLRGERGEHVEAQLDWVIKNAANIVEAEKAFAAVAGVAQQLGGQVVQQQSQSWSTQGSQQQYQPQQAAGPQGGKTCIHGDMTFREGVSKSSGKPYKAYFCPAPKGTPNQCSPEFVR